MNASYPDAATIRAAITLALRAPSVHNTQPWRWRVADDSVELYLDTGLDLSETDPDGRDRLISCGIALHHVRVGFAALGWRARVDRLPDHADRAHLASIELRPHEPTEQDVEVASAIPRRRTDRRYFSSWPVPVGILARLTSRAAQEGTLLTRADSFDYLRYAVTQAARVHAQDSNYQNELALWTGRNGSLDGVPSANISVSVQTDPLPTRRFPVATLAQPSGAPVNRDGSEVLVLSTASDDQMSRLRAGEATSAVMLAATVFGLATCPITEPLEIPRTRDFLRANVLRDSGYPQMLLRIGWTPANADPLPATPRRRFADLVSELDGKPFEG